VRRKLTLFDRGLFAIGPHPELAGRPLAALAVAARGRLEATLDAPGRFRSIDPQARTVPVDVSGELHGGPPRRRAIAVAVNGRVATTAWTIAAAGSEYYTAVLPPSALRPGANLVEPLAISKRSAGLRLTRLIR
jgi:hypothetical protein